VTGVATSLVELRILDGPNLYYPRAAVKLTLDLTRLVDAAETDAAHLATRMGLREARPGPPGTGFRQRFAGRAVARLARQVAAEAGTHRLDVLVRPARDVHRLVVAYPWRHRSRAEALGRAVAEVLDALPTGDVDQLVERASGRVRDADLGSAPRTLRPRIPVVAVTGSRGKSTTCRLLAHIARQAGRHVGWSSVDGIAVDGAVVEGGDHSGPSGAGRLLSRPDVDLAITETAHRSILWSGIGVTHNDVSVVTNVLGHELGGDDARTADQLAEVKAVVTRITRSDGWCVLNGDDPRVWPMRVLSSARPWVFSRDPDAPAVRSVLGDGGRATAVVDGWVCLLAPGADPDPLLRLDDVPLLARDPLGFGVENVLAAVSAAAALGLPREAVVTGLGAYADDERGDRSAGPAGVG
jgi:cyanophycin synthetase